MAEHITRHAVATHLGVAAKGAVEVASAGTSGWGGKQMEPFATRALASHGIVPEGFSARELSLGDIERADLVLGAAREHRAAAVKLLPNAAPRTYTLRQFARLMDLVSATDLPADVAERGRALVEQAARGRGFAPADRPGDDDVRDPFGRSERSFEQCFVDIETALRRPLALLLGTDG